MGANILQHTATDCNRQQQTATDCNRLQQTATQIYRISRMMWAPGRFSTASDTNDTPTTNVSNQFHKSVTN